MMTGTTVRQALRCTACHKEYPHERLFVRCPECDEPLEYDEVREAAIHPGNRTQSLFERYADFLPLERPGADLLGEGFTPLLASPDLADRLGIAALHLKMESQNPTWSFKDRGTAASLLHALECGYTRIGTASSGNMGASVAAYGARAGLETFVVVNDIPEEKLGPIAIYGPHVIRVKAPWDVLTSLTHEVGVRHGIYFTNADVPMRVEGYKTIAYEICEQLDFDAPDVVIVPTSAGGNIRGIEKGFREFYKLGLIERIPRFVASQPEACCPIHEACMAGRLAFEKVENPGKTFAGAIFNTAPVSGNQVLRLLRERRGTTAAVSDAEMLIAQRILAGEGVFAQPDSASAYASLQHLAERGEVDASSRVVCVITAGGLKLPSALTMQSLSAFDADTATLDACVRSIINGR